MRMRGGVNHFTLFVTIFPIEIAMDANNSRQPNQFQIGRMIQISNQSASSSPSSSISAYRSRSCNRHLPLLQDCKYAPHTTTHTPYKQRVNGSSTISSRRLKTPISFWHHLCISQISWIISNRNGFLIYTRQFPFPVQWLCYLHSSTFRHWASSFAMCIAAQITILDK